MSSWFAPVYFEDHTFGQLSKWIAEYDPSIIYLLVDENTHEHCAPLILRALDIPQRIELIEIPAGEEQKTIDIAIHIWSALTELNTDRKALMINVGGGVICDLGGFVAACFKRGIAYVNVPTTLLAMVDAAHGSKTGVDFEGLKNQIGLFNPPKATFVHDGFCQTLSKREFTAGFAECVKHALIADKELWHAFLLNGQPDPDLIGHYIEPSIEIKKQVVESDPLEEGRRKILNFGHTVGHAIESFFLEHAVTPLLHGEAVAMGLIAELYISSRTCGLSEAELLIATDYIKAVFPIYRIPERNFDALIRLMEQDKKNDGGLINFTLISEPGTSIVNFNTDEITLIESLAFINQHANQPTVEFKPSGSSATSI
ncbi:MAG TPA: 3-dehydroquinate synthase [Luteibaculaceae bacterium]|nr:3-dehydroquinate synthase [Luteibaculaceae bacterium]